MESRFPLLGFPNENNKPDGNVVYQCFFGIARIALWDTSPQKIGVNFELNIYKPLPDDAYRDDTLTDHRDRYARNQPPISVNDAFEAQLAIFYLIQKYLPPTLTLESNSHDISDAGQEVKRTHAAANQDGEVRADADPS